MAAPPEPVAAADTGSARVDPALEGPEPLPRRPPCRPRLQRDKTHLNVPRAVGSHSLLPGLHLLSLPAVWPLLSAQPCQNWSPSQEQHRLHKPSPEPPLPHPGSNPPSQPQTQLPAQPLPHGALFVLHESHNSQPDLWGGIPPPCHEVNVSQSVPAVNLDNLTKQKPPGFVVRCHFGSFAHPRDLPSGCPHAWELHEIQKDPSMGMGSSAPSWAGGSGWLVSGELQPSPIPHSQGQECARAAVRG